METLPPPACGPPGLGRSSAGISAVGLPPATPSTILWSAQRVRTQIPLVLGALFWVYFWVYKTHLRHKWMDLSVLFYRWGNRGSECTMSHLRPPSDRAGELRFGSTSALRGTRSIASTMERLLYVYSHLVIAGTQQNPTRIRLSSLIVCGLMLPPNISLFTLL